jgi:hypothetical protein
MHLKPMTEQWQSMETTTHQDHVIAHVIGTTVLAHIVLHDAVHLLLDIGFIWKIYVEGDMGLLPHPVAVAELEISDDARKRIVADIDLLLRGVRDVSALGSLTPGGADCRIEEVELLESCDRRKLVLHGEAANLELEMSVADDSISVTELPK